MLHMKKRREKKSKTEEKKKKTKAFATCATTGIAFFFSSEF